MNVVKNLTAPATRRIGQIAAVGAVALVLLTSMAAPTEARRRDAVSAANGAIDMCVVNGDNPDAYGQGGSICESCTWEDGLVDMAEFACE